jgi:glucose-6-phosphate 1-epimerase
MAGVGAARVPAKSGRPVKYSFVAAKIASNIKFMQYLPNIASTTMRAESTQSNGLPAVLLTHSSGASALIYVYAAHLASWKCGGEEQLYVSSAAEYGGGKAIRGGVPICWPQFAGRGPFPKHGFVRNSEKWRVLRTSTDPFPCVVLELCDDEETRAVFPPAFKLQYSVSLDGPNSVSTALAVINTGPEPLQFTTALHTYFKVSDVGGVAIHGLGTPALGCAAFGHPVARANVDALLHSLMT